MNHSFFHTVDAGKQRALKNLLVISSALAALFLLSPVLLFAQLRNEKFTPLEPAARDRQISRHFGIILRTYHLSKKPADATVSARAFDLYFKSLDPMKVYFYQSDFDEFSVRRNDLGKMLAAGNVSFAFDVFNRYLQRIDERIDTVIEILDQPIDLEEEDEIIVDRKILNYPKNETEARQRWVKRIKYDLLALKYDEITKAKDKAEKEAKEAGKELSANELAALEAPDWETLKKRLKRRFIFYNKRMHQTSNDDLLEMFLTAFSNSYDPHSSYMSPSSYINFMIQMRLNLDGIGATLQTVDGFTVVNKLVAGGAAAKSGVLKAEDRIVAVGQDVSGPMIDIYEMKINDVVAKVRGPKGTKVRLEIVAPELADQYAEFKEEGKSKPETKIVTIVREKIQLDDQAAKFQVFESGTKADGTPYKIGIIDLPAFYLDIEAYSKGDPNYRSTTRDIQNILRQCVADNVDAVVLDLRYNGGGSLQEVVTTTGLFVDRGTVVMTKDLSSKVNYLDDRDPSVEWTGPLVVVINKYSASASEIFAGAIKDYRRGLVIGDSTTHGKGSVQDLKDIGKMLFSGTNSSSYGALKLTVSAFYLPGGASPQLDGVSSDVVIPSIVDHMEDISERDLDYPLEFEKIPASPRYPTFPYVDAQMIAAIKKKSDLRIAANADFQRVLRDINTYLEYKAKKTMTLNEKKFFEEREKLRAEREEIKKIMEPEEGKDDSEKIKRTYYLDEVMAITTDYIQSLQESGVTFPSERAIRSSGGALNFLFGGN